MPKLPTRNHQCLLIEANGRNFFTHEENLPQLLEFCKSFDMSMAIVKIAEAPLLDLSDLPKAVCDAKKTQKTEYSLVRQVLPFDTALCIPLIRTRNQILETAKTIREKIHDRFSKGEAVSRDMLEEEFPEATITSATFMQHVRNARRELEAKGYEFERIAPGCYRAITPEQLKKTEEEKQNLQAQIQPIWNKFQTPKIKKATVWATPTLNFNYIATDTTIGLTGIAENTPLQATVEVPATKDTEVHTTEITWDLAAHGEAQNN